MSRKDFAQSINEFPGTYSACENASMCGSEKIAKLALCFGVSTDYLYGLTDDLRRQRRKERINEKISF